MMNPVISKKHRGPGVGRRALFALSCAVFMLSGCAGDLPSATEAAAPDLVWPQPPEQARIRYIRSFSNEDDVRPAKGSGLADLLLGEDDKTISGLQKPYGVTADARGRIFVTDTATGELVVFDVDNKEYLKWGTSGPGRLRQPLGVTADGKGRIYVSDGLDKRVVVFDADGNFIRAMGNEDELGTPVGIAVNEQLGRVYVVDSAKHHIAVYDEAGALVSTIGERGREPGQFNFPTNVAIDADGTLYVSDAMNFRVQVLDPEGKVLRMFGELGGMRGQFSRPKGVGVDSDGHIYVVDASFSNIQLFDPEGRLLLFVGKGGNGPGEFQLPAGMFVDRQDRIYVVDQFNYRIQVFQYIAGDSTAAD